MSELPSLEEVEALKRFWVKHKDDPKLDSDVNIVCIGICDDLIKQIKKVQTLQSGKDAKVLMDLGGT